MGLIPIRLLVLISSLGLMGLTPAPLEFARLPAGAIRTGEPPDLPDWRALATAPAPERPPAQPRDMALRAAETLPEFDHFSDPEFLAGIARRQGRNSALALVLLRGSFEVADLARAAADPAVLEQDGDVFTLHRPLVIRRGAALVLPEGSVLRLATASRAFLVNGGQLTVRGARITSWDAGRSAPSALEHDRQFRPFVAAIGGSWTEITRSTLSHLGYHAAKSYGLSLVSGPSSLSAAGPPTGRITGSRILGNYYGFYSYEAEGVVITDNALVDNIVYGLDPHDRSRRLVIAGNTATGTKRKHGIIVSRGVSDSWIVENRAIGNAGTGIVIDAASTDNIVARNLAGANGGDGFSLFESARNLLWGNLAIGNRKSGLRIRNGWALEIHRNAFVGNGYDGIEAYAEDLGPELENRWRSAPELRLGLSLADNLFAGNLRSALNVRNPGRIDLSGVRRGANARPLRFGGDLRAWAEEIEAHLEPTGSVRIIGREGGAAARPDRDS
jgi:poly(beta-D-mannuronate) C5 epimerase